MAKDTPPFPLSDRQYWTVPFVKALIFEAGGGACLLAQLCRGQCNKGHLKSSRSLPFGPGFSPLGILPKETIGEELAEEN